MDRKYDYLIAAYHNKLPDVAMSHPILLLLVARDKMRAWLIEK